MFLPHGAIAAVGTGHPAVEAFSPELVYALSGIVTALILLASIVAALRGFRDFRDAERQLSARANSNVDNLETAITDP
jgi:hypothetical protein